MFFFLLFLSSPSLNPASKLHRRDKNGKVHINKLAGATAETYDGTTVELRIGLCVNLGAFFFDSLGMGW